MHNAHFCHLSSSSLTTQRAHGEREGDDSGGAWEEGVRCSTRSLRRGTVITMPNGDPAAARAVSLTKRMKKAPTKAQSDTREARARSAEEGQVQGQGLHRSAASAYASVEAEEEAWKGLSSTQPVSSTSAMKP